MSDRTGEGGQIPPPAAEPSVAFLETFVLGLVDNLAATLGEDGARAFVAAAADGMVGDFDMTGRPGELAEGLGTMMRRIGGGFSVGQVTSDEIVLVNDRCPFGDAVEGREACCGSTETLLGRSAAAQRGYASVELAEAIARGDGRCLVRVHFVRGKPGRAFRA